LPDIITPFQPEDGNTMANMNEKFAEANAEFEQEVAHRNDSSLHLAAGEHDKIDNSAQKSTIATATLTAAGWTGSTAPYSQTVSVTGATPTSVNEILPGVSITADQLTALQAANLQDGGQAAGSITVKAWGDKPTIDLPVRIIVRGDM